MSLLADPAAAGLYGLALFLVVLGVLVVFVESIPLSRVFIVLGADLVTGVVLILLDEFGIAILVLSLGCAVIVKQVFEWLTTR